MTAGIRATDGVWRAFFLAAGLLVLAATAFAQTPAANPARTAPARPVDARPAVNVQAAGLEEFQTRLKQYLALRAGFASRLAPLSPTPDASELSARQESLAAAIRNARTTAKRGDLIPPVVATQIATTVRNDFQHRNPSARMGVFGEVPETPGASLINRTYPSSAALPTMPPLLLMNLPILPDNLQYRFSGRDVVILDGDVQVVIDYIAQVLPPH